MYDASTETYGFQNWEQDSEENDFLRPQESEQDSGDVCILPLTVTDETPEGTHHFYIQ